MQVSHIPTHIGVIQCIELILRWKTMQSKLVQCNIDYSHIVCQHELGQDKEFEYWETYQSWTEEIISYFHTTQEGTLQFTAAQCIFYEQMPPKILITK